MDYKFITIDGYQILVDNKRGFMNLTDIAKMLNCEVEKIKDPLNVSADSKLYTDTNVISCSDKTYYSLDVVAIFIFDYDYKIAFKLYESALNNGLIFNEYIKHKIDEEKKTYNELRSIVKEQEDVIDTFYKYYDAGNENNSNGDYSFISTESLQFLISLIKDIYDFGDGFGVIRDYSLLLDILYGINSALGDDEDEIKFDEYDCVSYIVKTMYNIIKKKPFIKGNEIIAYFIAYYYLINSELIEEEEAKITSSEDLCLAIGLIMSSNDDNAVDSLKKAKSLLAKHYDLPNYNYEKKPVSIFDTSKEGTIEYIISSIEDFSGYQGYYDFYKGKSIVYKIHYHGRYANFSLNRAKTFLSNNTLYFKGVLYCYSEAPTDLRDRDEFLKDIVEEIRIRSYSDVITPFLNSLKKKVKPYFDLNSISIKFDFDIKTKFDEDYEW